MAVVIAPYSHDHFQNLPDLSVARDKFAQLNGKLLVDKVFRPFFVQCGMDRTFGLAMQHRHFDILPGQKMVNYNNTSTAWDATPGEGMDEPQPTIWSFSSDDSLVPTEFKYSKGHRFVFGEKERNFVDQFKKLLDQEGLTPLFGLCEYPGDDFEGTCEITNGHANINLKPKDYPDGLEGADTAWFFSPPLLKRGCRCTCDARTKNHDHGTHVITRSG